MSKAPDLSEYTNEEIKDVLNEIRHPFDIAVFDSTNYFNFGSIIRSAHNFLCNKIYSVDLDGYYRPAASAAKKYEEINYFSLEEFIKSHSERSIVAMERRPGVLSPKDLITFQWPANPIICFGSEKSGLPDRLLEVATDVVSIPQYGVVNDFNVAVSAGIVMYDWIQKYYKNP